MIFEIVLIVYVNFCYLTKVTVLVHNFLFVSCMKSCIFMLCNDIHDMFVVSGV